MDDERKGKTLMKLYPSNIKCFTPLLTIIYNSADHPKDWSQGLIYPVHKKSDKSDPQNYRKVDLIISLARVFDFFAENRLAFKNLVWCEDDPLQRGFEKNCRTYALFYLCSTISLKLSRGWSSVSRRKYLNIIKSMFHKSSSRVK